MTSPSTCSGAAAIRLAGVGVRYRLPRGNTRSLKEFAVLALRRRLAFDEFWALREADLLVRQNERLGVVGRNGAGKSTLLQLMAGVLPPTEGALQIHGRVAPLLQLGAGFDPELSGRENVYLNGALLGMPRSEIRARFDSIIQFAELEHFVDAQLRTYSSGMAARLGFAVATASEPDILLLDEVLSVGDEAFQARCLARVRDFSARGATMVLVTHDADMVVQECTRAIWVESGRIRADGAPAEVVEEYRAFLTERSDGRSIR